jgi:hypothetical protein
MFIIYLHLYKKIKYFYKKYKKQKIICDKKWLDIVKNVGK